MKRLVVLLIILILMLNGAALASDWQPSHERMRNDLKLLVKGDRASGSPNEKWAAEVIAVRFRELGLEVITQPFTAREIRSQNVIGIKRGSDPQAGVITVTAHYDSADLGIPGANDNGSGTVVILELARLWAELSPKSTIYFITFGAEEQGLLGAKHFLTTPLAEDVVLNLNLDMVGRGNGVTLDQAPAWLMRGLYQSARTHGYEFSIHLAGLAAVRQSGSPTDGAEFAKRGIPGFSLAASHGFQDPYIHTPIDDLENVSVDALERSATVINDLLKRLDGQRLPWGSKHFIAVSILGFLIILPEWVTYLLIALALALPIWLSWRAAKQRQITARGLPLTVLSLLLLWGLLVGLGTEAVMMNRRIMSWTGKVPGDGSWTLLQGVALATLVAWFVYGQILQRILRGDNRLWQLVAVWLPVLGLVVMTAAGQFEFAMLVVPLVLCSGAMLITTNRWARLSCYALAWGPFLHLASSSWVVQRYGMLKLVSQVIYLPMLALLTVQMVGRGIWDDGVTDIPRGRRRGVILAATMVMVLVALYLIPFCLPSSPNLVTISEYHFPGVTNVRISPRDPVGKATLSGLGLTIPLTSSSKPPDEFRTNQTGIPAELERAVMLRYDKLAKGGEDVYTLKVETKADTFAPVVTLKSQQKIEFDQSAYPGVHVERRGNELALAFYETTSPGAFELAFSVPAGAKVEASASAQIGTQKAGVSPWQSNKDHLILQRKVYVGDVLRLN